MHRVLVDCILAFILLSTQQYKRLFASRCFRQNPDYF